MQIEATVGFEHTLKMIEGKGKKYFRVDDKKSKERITEDSKYHLVSLTATRVVILTVGRKHKKYSLVINDYEDIEKWGIAVWKFFSKKIIQEIEPEEFEEDYIEYIRLLVEDDETEGDQE